MIILRSVFMLIFIITSSAGAETNTFIMCFMCRKNTLQWPHKKKSIWTHFKMYECLCIT